MQTMGLKYIWKEPTLAAFTSSKNIISAAYNDKISVTLYPQYAHNTIIINIQTVG